MDALLGTSPTVFLIMTVVLFGAAAWSMGRAIAQTWRPAWQVVPYAVLLAAADRFLAYALADAQLLAPLPFVIAALLLAAIALLAWRVAHVATMLQQYPWLYERAGPLAYRER
jgi:branched-chain amino acid transport system ATP-binding protein